MNKFFASSKNFSVKEIAEITNAKIIGNSEAEICSLSSIEKSNSGDLTFFNDKKFLKDFQNTKATACFVSEKYEEYRIEGLTLLVVNNPYLAYANITNVLYPYPSFEKDFIASSAVVDKTSTIGKGTHISDNVVIKNNVIIADNTYIGPNTIIYDNVEIGANCYILGNVSIKYSIIGDNCIIHDGVRLGQDGFGFAFNPSGHIKIQQIGSVIIENNVEIGANTCIDRGAINDTIIGEGTKIDNLVHLAHNVQIGKHCFLAGQVGIAGGTKVNDYVSIAGQAGIAPHIEIATGSQIVAKSGVTHSIVEPNKVWMGIPIVEFTTFWRLQVIFKKLLNKNLK